MSEKEPNQSQSAGSQDELLDFSPQQDEAKEEAIAQEKSPLEEAKVLFENGEYERCRAKLSEIWLKAPYDRAVIELFAELLSEIGEGESSKRFSKLVEKLKEPLPPYKHHQELFEVGYALVDMRQFQLATMILSEIHQELPEDPLVNYELGFSLMCLKDFARAVGHFEKFKDKRDDFDVILNLCVCYTLLRNEAAAAEALAMLRPLAESEEEKLEVEHRQIVLKRLAKLSKKKTLNDRDWFFILYGSILLRPGKTLTAGKAEIKDVAASLAILKGLLSGISVEEEGVEFYSLRSKPMATVFGEMFGLPSDSYRGPDRPDRCLLLMSWTTDILGPHQVFIQNGENRGLFALAISPSEPLPVVPDIISYVSEDLYMPWEGKEQNARELEQFSKRLFEKLVALESDPDILKETQESIDYYLDKLELLVFNNHIKFPSRPEYTAELPRQ